MITWDQQDLYLRKSSKTALTEWWKKTRDRPLWKIQVEALDRTIDFMEHVDRRKASANHPEAPRLEENEFEQLREENLKMLKARRASIEAAEQHYCPRSLEHYFGTMILLPWGKGRQFDLNK